jgi:hypothetical protein
MKIIKKRQYNNFDPLQTMATVEENCSVCMENINEKNQCVRPCGHMMCVTCDASWRSRGKIEEVRMKKVNSTTEKFSVYITSSCCPMCRRKDEPKDYQSRSKESLFHEIQFLTQTLYYYGVKNPIVYKPPQVTETPAPIPHVQHAVVTPYIPDGPVVQVVAPVVTQVAVQVAAQVSSQVAAQVAAPVVSSSTSGTCCRKVHRLGCYTSRTKLRCGACNRFLCRSCRGTGCVCA